MIIIQEVAEVILCCSVSTNERDLVKNILKWVTVNRINIEICEDILNDTQVTGTENLMLDYSEK